MKKKKKKNKKNKKKKKKKNKNENKNKNKNKAGYTATRVARAWAEAVRKKVTRALGQER